MPGNFAIDSCSSYVFLNILHRMKTYMYNNGVVVYKRDTYNIPDTLELGMLAFGLLASSWVILCTGQLTH